MAKKKLGIPTDIIIQYAACSKCHKLYDINKLLDKTEVQTCGFINFPNHTMQRFRQPCNNPLTKEINNNNQQVFCPIKTYPLGNIRQQLTLFLVAKILRHRVKSGQIEKIIQKRYSTSMMV